MINTMLWKSHFSQNNRAFTHRLCKSVTVVYVAINIICLYKVQAATAVKFTQDAEVENLLTREKSQVKKMEVFSLQGETPFLVRMNEKIPMFLLPLEGARSAVEISGYPLLTMVAARSQKDVDQILSDVLNEIGTIQNLTKQRQFDLALQKVNDILTKYPEVHSLKFMKGSLLFLKGNKTAAQIVLKEALNAHPENIEGKKLLEEMKDP